MNAVFRREKDGYSLRLAEKEDAGRYYSENFHPLDGEVSRMTGSKEFYSEKEVVSFFLAGIDDPCRVHFLIFHPSGRIVGESVLIEIDEKTGSAHYRIALFHPEDRGKGLGLWATETVRDYAFDVLGLRLLTLEVFSFNARAEKCYRKAGFRRDAVLPGRGEDGSPDVVLMSVRKSERDELLKKRPPSDRGGREKRREQPCGKF